MNSRRELAAAALKGWRAARAERAVILREMAAGEYDDERYLEENARSMAFWWGRYRAERFQDDFPERGADAKLRDESHAR